MGATASTSKKASNKEVVPPWVYTVKVPPESAADQFAGTSEGMSAVGPNTVTRHRPGQFDTDGARWSRGFTSGKHTFEVVYPAAHRGTEATVGVGTEEAPLHSKGRVALVGNNKLSWGICLRSRRAFHKGAITKKYPATQVFLPDKFYMYLDADAGVLQFGSDLDYYGSALSGIPRQQPLYPMVSATTQGATITIVYRGRGDVSALGPPPPAIVPAGPQMMSPTAQRNEPPPPPPPTVVSNTVPPPPETKTPIQEEVIEEKAEEPAPEPEKKPEPEPEVKAEAEAEPAKPAEGEAAAEETKPAE